MKRGHTYRSRRIPGADFFVLQVNTRQVSGWWVRGGKVIETQVTMLRVHIDMADWTEVDGKAKEP
jgi:hypothetical protein